MGFEKRFLRVPDGLEINRWRVKRYHVNVDDAEIEPAVQAAAKRYLPRLLPEPDGTPSASFVVLHRGEDGTYLNAYSWVWEVVVECHGAVAGVPSLGCPDEDPTNFTELAQPWIGCVWELPALAHERTAWVRHMLAPDTPDLDAYLADTLAEGPVGQ